MQSDRELMQQALEALENTTAEWRALADSGDAGFWKAEDQDDYKQCVAAIAALRERLAQPEQEPVAHSIVAGALFDFMGWLTTCSERLVLSSADDAAPAADAIKNFAQMRSLSINDAQVQRWQEHLADSQPRQWVGLTEEEIDQTVDEEDWYNDPNEFARAIEAKLKEKNT